MSTYITAAALLAAGAIHLLPLAGVLGPARLQMLYGIAVDDPNLLVLLRHRAVLFGLLGGALLVAAFRQQFAGPALLAAIVSVGAFLALALTTPGLNAALGRVVVIDAVVLALLIAAAIVWWASA
jgi:hypothetical protein